ncbi:hypothetical protein BC938DRAFT_472784 [Jimgerdemannia flammicorona]|uniref:Uncharacterized protein n=1 Tax=Jimgerdemannia flammicorona TaxID=994334 RepID=A0A433QTQ7_9FUNG|nr:hypothetical protein BC938DRAFT_472784 [Jimgerdemannia flammicorona]
MLPNPSISPSQQRRIPSHGPNTRIIAAIDFGTTHSGFALVHVSGRIPEANYLWDDQLVPYCKNLTAILYEYSSTLFSITPSVESWGYSAIKNIPTYGLSKQSHFCSRFKLHLDESVSRQMPPLPPGYTVLEIIADYFRCLHGVFCEELKKSYGDTITPEAIAWYLTVPAMWSEHAKQQMRMAVVLAGIVPEEAQNDSSRLNIVLEPEAAALWCCEKANENMLQSGDAFIIVDAGGGTIDLTAHEILRDNNTGAESLREIVEGIGGPFGSTFVDDKFAKFVESRCGASVVQNFRNTHKSEWFMLMKAWEQLKREFKGPESFSGRNSEKCLEIPRKLCDQMDQQHLEDTRSNLVITLTDMLNMFDPIVDKALDLVEKHLDRSQKRLAMKRKDVNAKINRMCFVGGFSASKYLWRRAQEKFGDRIEMVCPVDPGSAVVKGAVICGLNTRFITSRCARLTYGVKTSGPWTSTNPLGESAKYWNEVEAQMDYADNLFHAIVRRGQSVGVHELIQTVFFPVLTTQDIAKLELYTTDRDDEIYMVPSMRLAATLAVPLSRVDETLPVKLLFVQDASPSMNDGDKLSASKDGIKDVCHILNTADEVGLIKFSKSVITIWEGVQNAFKIVQQNVQVLKNADPDNHQKTATLDLSFGSTQVTAEAFNEDGDKDSATK